MACWVRSAAVRTLGGTAEGRTGVAYGNKSITMPTTHMVSLIVHKGIFEGEEVMSSVARVTTAAKRELIIEPVGKVSSVS